jgi:hypothetical protein
MKPENWISRLGDRATWIGTTTAMGLVFYAGGFLLMLPFMHIAVPSFDLLALKFAAAFGGSTVVALVGLALMLLAAALRQRIFRRRQQKNDQIADRIMGDLRANADAPVPSFYLYLRAFETTGRLHIPLFLRLRKLSVGMSSLSTNDVESHLSDAIRRIGPLIALGHPGETFGAGRIDTDDSKWTADIRVLMARARGILLVPSHRPGTLWEIETLKNEGWLAKCIFIMPPRAVGELDTKQRWEVARQALALHQLDAPEYQEHGLLFEVGPDGHVSNVEPMLLTSGRQMRKSLERLLSADPPRGGLFKSIARAERQTTRATRWGWAETLRQLSPYALALAGLVINRPGVGFNPKDSWATVLNRTMAGMPPSEREIAADSELESSEQYVAASARAADPAAMRQKLVYQGLLRLTDEERRAYFSALSQVLSAVETPTCAAFARGNLSKQEHDIALTYMSWLRVEDFRDVERHAIRAALTDAPIVPISAPEIEEASDKFLASLGPTGERRFVREVTPEKPLSDDDSCWRARHMYQAVSGLPDPHGRAWAHQLAAILADEPAPPPKADPSPVSPPDPPSPPPRPRPVPSPENVLVNRLSMPDPGVKPPAPPATPRPRSTDTPQPRRDAPANPVVPSSPEVAPAFVAPSPVPPAPEPAYRPPNTPSAVAPSYGRLLDEAVGAIGARRMDAAANLVDQLISTDPARGEGWALRGLLAMQVYGNLQVAYQSYSNAIARGSKASFRVVHDHGPDRPPCIGSLEMTAAALDFKADDGGHRFSWPLNGIREAAINGLYGSAVGMFHIKAQTPGSGDTFNFAATRVTDVQVVNRRADAQLILQMMNELRTAAR